MSLQRNNTPTKARSAILQTAQRIPATARVELGRLASDAKLDLRARTLAATALARLPDTQAIADLEALVEADESVARAALRALGRRGSPNSIPALQRVIAGKSSRANRVAAGFAAALIAHRFNLSGHDLPSPAKAAMLAFSPRDARPMQFHEADAKEVARLHRSLAADAPGLELAKRGWHIECRGRHSVFALAAELATSWDAAAFTRRKLHVGQVALENHSNGAFSPGLTVLSDPEGEGCLIGIYRGDGTLVMAGRGQPKGTRIELRLAAADRVAAFPTDIHIVVGPDALDVVSAQVGPGTPRNHPKPMVR